MELGILTALTGITAAWLPIEVFPWTGVLVVALVAVHTATGEPGIDFRFLKNATGPFLALALWVAVGLLSGWDRATAASELGLAAMAAVVIWRAARHAPADGALEAFSLGVSLLTLWAVWQVTAGLHADLANLTALPAQLQEMARQKILTGRAFAALGQPGHLAVLLATIVPIAADRISTGRRRIFWGTVLVSCFLGITLTRSLLGTALAITGLILGWKVRQNLVWKAIIAGALGSLLVVAALRTDLTRMEPVRQRLENWKAAVWVLEGSPVTGVGLGGFGQAALGYPGATANHPQHAHCLILEWSAEMGLAGGGLAILFFFWVAKLAALCWRIDRGLAGAVLIVPLHNLFDFSLFGWGIAIPWAVIAGWTLAATHTRRTEMQHSTDVRKGMLAAGAIAGIALAVILNAAGASAERRAAITASPRTSIELAERARALAPWRFGVVQTIAAAAAQDHHLTGRAIGDLEAARWWRPHSPALAISLAQLELAAHDTPAAMEEAARAAAGAPPSSPLKRAATALLGAHR